ncbi:hypothetical protein ACJ72_01169 [Emergomyces africanus]|uniref:Protein kinase domain-containing protein n=1 Tax=Emergomyces africanus TaxID=1955775 RepID=A0A1B7P655_9EURO|nr:hypothetical protein ACJ72_01169 [Emergomyces africanus]
MADLQGRKVFKVFNQDFVVDERYTVTKELGQGAYGIVWSVTSPPLLFSSANQLPEDIPAAWMGFLVDVGLVPLEEEKRKVINRARI